MKKVLQMCEKTKDSPVKGESQLKSLSEAMDFMTSKFEEYERERQEWRINYRHYEKWYG